MRESIVDLEKEVISNEKIMNDELSIIKGKKNNEVTPRSHG